MSSFLKFFTILFAVAVSSLNAFSQVNFTSSNLPIVVINTNSATIVDDPKIYANLGIIWNGAGKRNNLTDPMNNYNGKIGIEIRGSSSQSLFPKKSYGFETKSADLESTDVSLLGLPAENDWILYAPYSDKTLIRNVLTFTLDAALGHYSPRCRFVELVLNGNYQGVYVLMEKIKRNDQRVDIAKLKSTDNSGEDLTGGYIIKIDKDTGSGGDGWTSDFYNNSGRTYYQYEYPKYDDITVAQKSYIQNYVREMERSLYQGKYEGADSYHEYLNDSSFIDFMIVNELAKNVDGYRISSFLYKGKNDLLNCGPIWDFNLAYGNANYYNGWVTSGFQYQANLGNDNWQNPFWWNKLIQNPEYSTNLKKRWSLLRKNELSTNRITFVIDSLTNLLVEAGSRNFQRWPVIGSYVWPNYYVGPSYNSEISWMKNWISGRLAYLDQQWYYDFTGTDDVLASGSVSVYPIPFKDKLNIQFPENLNQQISAELYSAEGRLLLRQTMSISGNQFQLSLSGSEFSSSGLYVLRIISDDRVWITRKIIRE